MGSDSCVRQGIHSIDYIAWTTQLRYALVLTPGIRPYARRPCARCHQYGQNILNALSVDRDTYRGPHRGFCDKHAAARIAQECTVAQW